MTVIQSLEIYNTCFCHYRSIGSEAVVLHKHFDTQIEDVVKQLNNTGLRRPYKIKRMNCHKLQQATSMHSGQITGVLSLTHHYQMITCLNYGRIIFLKDIYTCNLHCTTKVCPIRLSQVHTYKLIYLYIYTSLPSLYYAQCSFVHS